MNGEFYTNDYNNINKDNNNLNIPSNIYNGNNYLGEIYVDNILKANKGKKVELHATIPGSSLWQDKTFEGIIEETGKDYIVLSNPTNGEWYLVPIMYIAYITFLESINNVNNRFYS